MRKKRQLSELQPNVQANLDLRLTDLDFSTRATSAFAFARMEFVGELIQTTVGELLSFPNCGRKTIEEIEERLSELGLHLDLVVSDWNSQTARARLGTGPARRHRPTGSVVSKRASCLEDEFKAILDMVVSGRDHAIVEKHWGWGGGGRRTLESVGEEYGVTRERIRQIAWKAERRIRKYNIDTPWLAKTLEALSELCPATPSFLGDALRSRGIIRSAFDVGALRFACDLLGRDYKFSQVHVGAGQIVVRTKGEEKIAEFFRLCRRLTSGQGCVNFDAICDELSISESDRAGLRRSATTGGCVWLDEENRWLHVTGTARNRLANLVAKVLSVCPSLPLSELRKAVGRSRRLSSLPPTPVLGRFVVQAGLAAVSGDRVSALSSFPDAVAPGSIEETLVSVLNEHGPVLGWERFQELCLARGMNPISFSINISASPVVSRLARGIYALVGADVPPGLVDEVAAQAAANRKTADWGWTARGTLWCSFQLTIAAISAGSVMIPAFVESVAEGDWKASFAGREIEDTVKCGNGFFWGLKRLLTNFGAEAGDVCIVEFDLVARTAAFTLGDEDLAEAWERGEDRLIVQADGGGDGDE